MCNCSGYSGKPGSCLKCNLWSSLKGAILFALLASPFAYSMTKQGYLVHALVYFVLSLVLLQLKL